MFLREPQSPKNNRKNNRNKPDVPRSRWQVEDITQRLAGGDLGDRAKQPSALSRTLSRALNITVTTVTAGQVKPIRTTVEQP